MQNGVLLCCFAGGKGSEAREGEGADRVHFEQTAVWTDKLRESEGQSG